MPVSFTRTSALQIIANQKFGFTFGKPERVDDNSLAVVLPILRQTSFKRHYVTLPETEKVEISDTGSINRMKFENKSGENIYIRSGSIFKGSTQERALTRSAVLLPQSVVELDVRCVHQTRGIQQHAMVKLDSYTPLDFEQMSYTENFAPKDQSAYWANVSHVSMRMSRMYESSSSHAPRQVRALRPTAASLHNAGIFREDSLRTPFPRQDDLASNVADFTANFDEVLRKVKRHKTQVGLGLITEKGCETIELFDVPASWKALHADAVKRLGSSIIRDDKSDVFEYKPEKAIEAVQKVLMLGFDQKVLFEHRSSNGEPSVSVVGLKSEAYTGEVVEIDQRVAHLVLFRMNKN